MAILDYKGFFAEQHQGNAPYLQILTQAVTANRDAAISADDRDKLSDALRMSAKQQKVMTIFSGTNQQQKVLQLNQLAYQSRRNVCLIDCVELASKYIGETEKNLATLIANAEGKNWILFFDEADALFATASRQKNITDKITEININAVVKYISGYQGLSVLNIQHKQHVTQIGSLSDYVIQFDH